MQTAFLFIESHGGRTGLVRIALAQSPPRLPEEAQPGPRRIHYLARYNDGDAALMHVHELLHRHLVDVDSGLYKVSVEQAVAAAESLDLAHERLFLDPALGDAALIWIETRAEALVKRRRLHDRLFYLLGYAALALGIAQLLMVLFV